MRIGRGPVPSVYAVDETIVFQPGKIQRLQEGTDCTLVAAGEMVHPAWEATRMLGGRWFPRANA